MAGTGFVQCCCEQSRGIAHAAFLCSLWRVNTWKCFCPGACAGAQRSRRKDPQWLQSLVLQMLRCVNFSKVICQAVITALGWKIEWLGRAFSFTCIFPVWFMPKCRTQKSAYGVVKERAVHFYSIKNTPYGKNYYANNSIGVLIYIPQWCNSALAAIWLDWFILAESLTLCL